MKDIESIVRQIDRLLKNAGVRPEDHPLIQRRARRKAKSPLRQPHEDLQARRERELTQTIEPIDPSPTWLDIVFHHLENFGNIRQP